MSRNEPIGIFNCSQPFATAFLSTKEITILGSIYRIPLTLEPQPEGGFVVTSSALPELITEGDTVDEALANARDAFNVFLEIYEDNGKPLPPNLLQDARHGPIQTEQLAAV
jgi:antitoxin HicB